MNTEKSIPQSLILPAIATGVVLLVPLIAMQFTNEVAWNLTDFILAGALIFGTGAAYTLITRKSGKTTYRYAVGLALFSALLLIWVNGAVGIIGSENNPINLWYFGVIAVGIIGAFLSRFKSKEMTLTLFAMAFTIAMVAGVALLRGAYQLPESSVIEILGVNGVFIMLFVVSGLLFKRAARETLE